MSTRAQEVARMLYEAVRSDAYGTTQTLCEAILRDLPEFNPPKSEWMKCSERMPNNGEPIWNWNPANPNRPPSPFVHEVGLMNLDEYWMPRFVPDPPVEEESACVKELRAVLVSHPHSCLDDEAIDKAIAIVKKHEGAKK